MAEWDPDITIDEPLVRALLAEQFPQLGLRSVCLLGEGFDNSVWAIDREWAFRFPRRALAVPLVARELAVLARVAPLVPIPVPVPAFVGTESELFERPFWGHRLLAGVEPGDIRLTDADRIGLGLSLSGFLRTLHAPATRDAVDVERALPVDPNRRADMPYRIQMARVRLDLVDIPSEIRDAAEEILASADGLPPGRSEALVHGDLHVRHILVANGEVSGVIDWGDVCRGDPAIDLPFFWMVVPPHARHEVLAEYGAIDEATKSRARVLAIMLSAVLVLYAKHQGLTGLEQESRTGLERALVD